jgi:hypothetical protein
VKDMKKWYDNDKEDYIEAMEKAFEAFFEGGFAV